MNTFKTTACMLLLTTAGFVMENDGTPPHTPLHHQHANIVTPIQQALGGLHIGTPAGTPVHGIQPQQLFANTPEHVQQQHVQFVTPQGQMIQQVMPGAPVAPAHEQHDADEYNGINHLVGSVTSSPPLTKENKKRKSFGDITVLDPKGNVFFTTVKTGKGASSSSAHGWVSPTSITDLTRLETSGRTPAVHPSMLQFTTDKNIASRTWFDPAELDVDDAYLPTVDEVSVVGNDDSALNDGSFHIQGAGVLNTGMVVQDESMGSFIIPLDNSVDDSVAEDDTVSVIPYAGSEEDHDLDMGDDELGFSDEE